MENEVAGELKCKRGKREGSNSRNGPAIGAVSFVFNSVDFWQATPRKRGR
jgi:hypothetical protein